MTEHDEQCALFDWIDTNKTQHPELGLIFAVPNGTRTSLNVARKMKQEGAKKGVPDINCPISRGGYIGLWIEMKMLKNYPTKEQKWWLAALKEQGHYTAVCHGWVEAANLIVEYLNGKVRK